VRRTQLKDTVIASFPCAIRSARHDDASTQEILEYAEYLGHISVRSVLLAPTVQTTASAQRCDILLFFTACVSLHNFFINPEDGPDRTELQSGVMTSLVQ
jgi:predicted metal-dependent enzyme (double-stranded beta helix superfamily)